MARLRLEALTKVFPSKPEPVRAVDALNLELREAELLVLLGPSGCGKTTTLRLIAGLEEPTSGAILMDSKDASRVSPRDRKISMVSQNPALFPQLTVEQNVELGLKLRKRPAEERRAQVQEVAGLLRISDLLSRYPEELSGGQQQRVALGRALVISPSVFLLDEPLSNLDPGTRVELRGEIAAIQKCTGVPMIYVTHDQAEAMAVGHRIAVMNRGRIEQIGTGVELYYKPANVFVARFVGTPAINLLDVSIERSGDAAWCRLGQFEFPLKKKAAPPTGGSVLLGFRAEHVSFVEQDGLVARVLEITLALPDVFVRVDLEGRSVVGRSSFPFGRSVGDEILLHLDMERAVVFDPVTGCAL